MHKALSLLVNLTLLAAALTGCWQASTPAPMRDATATAPAALATPSPTFSPSPTATPEPCPLVPGQHPCASDVTLSIGSGQAIAVRIHYLLYLPGDYGKDPTQKWPLILFLHGSGQIGSDLNLLKTNMLPSMLETRTDFPFIVVSPQLPGPGAWTSEQSATQIQYWSPLIDPLNILLDEIPARYAIDSRRVYLTGLSLGGFGTWEFALRYPQRFAAIVPVAGGYQFNSSAIPPGICTLKDLPVWVFYGGQDTTVKPVQSESMIKALRACGGNVRDTFYPDANHSQSWIRAYTDPTLWEWLLQQELK